MTAPPDEPPTRYDQPPLLPPPSWPAAPQAQAAPPLPQSGPHVSQARPARQQPPRRRRIIVLSAGVLAMALIGGGAYALTTVLRGHGSPSAQPQGNVRASATPHPTARQPTPAQSGPQQLSASPSSQATSPTAPASPPGEAVTVTAAAAGNPAAPEVEALLNRYFTAINRHDYAGYQSVLDQQLQQGNSPSSFAAGYKTTKDSAETLTGISDTADGGLAASVTFISHQDPADSPSNSSCTDWAITLYLVPSGGSYLIGSPPSDYQASYQPC